MGLLFGLTLPGSQGDLGCVEKLRTAVLGKNTGNDAVGHTGDEVADVVVAGKQRHGIEVGGGRLDASAFPDGVLLAVIG